VEGVGPETAIAITAWEQTVDLSAELRKIADFGAHVITWRDPLVPRQLREAHNAPLVLTVWGRLDERDQHAVSVIGSRRTSHYGVESAKKLSYQLAYAGYTVVSGLALGIDTWAHTGALAAKGRTVAVIGSGLRELYPPENKGLAERIVNSDSGAVLSEYAMDQRPDRQTFPYRNRIVAAWGLGTLVVEAGLNSGALITANQALDYGRQIFAVPSQIDRPHGTGCNKLIQQGAKLVMSADDILEDLTALFPERGAPVVNRVVQETDAPDLFSERSTVPAPSVAPRTHEESLLLGALESGDLTLDELVAATRLPAYKVSSVLMLLELKRQVKALPGQRYTRPGTND
jgi:DNA processing protein